MPQLLLAAYSLSLLLLFPHFNFVRRSTSVFLIFKNSADGKISQQPLLVVEGAIPSSFSTFSRGEEESSSLPSLLSDLPDATFSSSPPSNPPNSFHLVGEEYLPSRGSFFSSVIVDGSLFADDFTRETTKRILSDSSFFPRLEGHQDDYGEEKKQVGETEEEKEIDERVLSLNHLVSSAPFPTAPNSSLADSSSMVASVLLMVIGRQVALPVTVGGQRLRLVLDTLNEGLRLFQDQTSACVPYPSHSPSDPPGEEKGNEKLPLEPSGHHVCYRPHMSKKAKWCYSDTHSKCLVHPNFIGFLCRAKKKLPSDLSVKYPPLYFDGINHTEYRLEGIDQVTLRLPNSRDGEDLVLEDDSHPIKLITEMNYSENWDAFKKTDGFWGIAGPSLCCREASLWTNLLRQHNISRFAFDINVPLNNSVDNVESSLFLSGNPLVDAFEDALERDMPPVVSYPSIKEKRSELHLGGYSDRYGPMQWSERKQTGGMLVDAWYQCTVYDLEVCGVSLFDESSNNWEVAVDLSSECLVLPVQLWEHLMRWIPENMDDCLPDPHGAEEDFKLDHPLLCSPMNNGTTRPLPSLSFKLHDDPNAKPLIIPLEQLVIWDERQKKDVLCVVPEAPSWASLEFGRTYNPHIKFGTLVLNSLYVVMDQENWRLGFAQKLSGPSAEGSCAKKAECKTIVNAFRGDQLYDMANNRCDDPLCSLWYLKRLNHSTKRCETASFMPSVVITLIATLAVTDLLSYQLYRRAVAKARTRCR